MEEATRSVEVSVAIMLPSGSTPLRFGGKSGEQVRLVNGRPRAAVTAALLEIRMVSASPSWPLNRISWRARVFVIVVVVAATAWTAAGRREEPLELLFSASRLACQLARALIV